VLLLVLLFLLQPSLGCPLYHCCSTLGDSAVKTEPVVEQFFVLRAANEGERVLPLERQVGEFLQ
jgi:hypothetical protein